MTFREKVAEAIAEKLYHTNDGSFTNGCRPTVVITRLRKDAENLLREFRDNGSLREEVRNAALRGADPAEGMYRPRNTQRHLLDRLSSAHVSIADMKISLYNGSVYVFPEKDAETVASIFGSRVPDFIVEDTCSSRAKSMAAGPDEEAAEPLVSWIDSIPVVSI